MFLYSKWMELPLLTRVKIAEVFGIPKTGATEVSSNVVVKDGYAVKDIEEKLTIIAMQDYLSPVDGGEDFSELFSRVIEKVMYVPPVPVVQQEVITRTTVTETIVKPVAPPDVVLIPKEQEKLAEEVAGKPLDEIITTGEDPTKPESHAETKKSSKK